MRWIFTYFMSLVWRDWEISHFFLISFLSLNKVLRTQTVTSTLPSASVSFRRIFVANFIIGAKNVLTVWMSNYMSKPRYCSGMSTTIAILITIIKHVKNEKFMRELPLYKRLSFIKVIAFIIAIDLINRYRTLLIRLLFEFHLL